MFVTVTGEERTYSVMEEQTVTLGTGLIKIQGYDQILWKFEGQIIAEINQGKNLLIEHDSRVERLKSRLQLNETSGSLKITRTKSTDSGVYHLQMNSRSHTLQRNITVTVSGE